VLLAFPDLLNECNACIYKSWWVQHLKCHIPEVLKKTAVETSSLAQYSLCHKPPVSHSTPCVKNLQSCIVFLASQTSSLTQLIIISTARITTWINIFWLLKELPMHYKQNRLTSYTHTLWLVGLSMSTWVSTLNMLRWVPYP
jgi:hypothetical protein